jgi:gluconate kinase
MTRRVVIMGVSGCGKSSVGAGLAARLGLNYRDGDDLHPPENVAKMRAGMPLSLLDSQFAALEPPAAEEAITVSIDQPLEAIVADILRQLP